MNVYDFRNLYFVCTGNTCRSPMAQRIFQQKVEAQGNGDMRVHSRKAEVESFEEWRNDYPNRGSNAYLAGGNTSSFDDMKGALVRRSDYSPIKKKGYGARISPGTEAVILSQFGDTQFVNEHRARDFTVEELEEADLIITMEPSHKQNLMYRAQAYSPDKKLKVYTLGELSGDPLLRVADPVGRDIGFLRTMYEAETGDVLHGDELDDEGTDELEMDPQARLERRMARMRERDERMDKHFDEGRSLQLRAQAYMPTFTQLTELIETLCKRDDINLQSIDDIFKDEMTMRHGQYHRKKSSFADIGGMISEGAFFRADKNASELYRKGDYTGAFEMLKNEQRAFLQEIQGLDRMYKLATKKAGKKLGKEYKTWQQAIHNKIVPALLQGNLLTADWGIDYQLAGYELLDNLVLAARAIPAAMRKADRDTALAHWHFARALVNLAEKVYLDERIDGVYHALT